MPRKRTGTTRPHGDHFDARITLNDGSRPWIHLPPGLTDKQARAKAASLTETARKGGGVLAAKAALKEAKGEACAAWIERWLASREARGLTSVDTDRGRTKKWILPMIGDKPIATVKRADVEAIVEFLDAAVVREEVTWKTALNVWGPFPPTCDCGGAVEATGEVQSTVVQDIPPVEVRNTRHVAHVGRCKLCEKRHAARLPGSSAQGEPCAQVQLGPGVQALSISLHFEHHVPLLGVVKILDCWFGVGVSAPGLSQMFDRLRVRTAPARNEILVQLRQSAVVGFDETSHRQDGHDGWLWLGRTPEVSYFHADPSRGGHVFAQILGEGFVGIVCSDFYAVSDRRPLC